MGGIYGCAYQQVGVVRMFTCGYCKEEYRLPPITYPTPLVVALFCSYIATSLFILKMFFVESVDSIYK